MTTLRESVLKTLRYSDHFDFPLTAQECFSWSPQKISLAVVRKELRKLIKQRKVQSKEDYYCLPDRSSIIPLRQQRFVQSQKKWRLARQVGERLARIPTVQLIAVTGSLAMNNSGADDDLDLMIVTAPNTLWLTRPLVWLFLRSNNLRRAPLTSRPDQIRDKVCDNLYLESSRLFINHESSQSLYLAHEILQAKPIFDRRHTYQRFLSANSWVFKIMPNFYPAPRDLRKRSLASIERQSEVRDIDLRSKVDTITAYLSLILYPLNLLFFFSQYLYMKPKMTSERISLHSAFFHPSPQNQTPRP